MRVWQVRKQDWLLWGSYKVEDEVPSPRGDRTLEQVDSDVSGKRDHWKSLSLRKNKVLNRGDTVPLHPRMSLAEAKDHV